MTEDKKCDIIYNWEQTIQNIRYVAAPMVDMSHLPFRMLWRKYGAQLCYTPMFHANLFANDFFYRQEMFKTTLEDRPLIVQFCANDPETFIKAAKLVEDQCDAVDLNLGCPQIIAKKGHYGAFLQEEWELVSEIVKRASQSLKIPVTCKIRILPGPVEKTVEYAKLLEKSGCSLLTVHGRTRDQKGHATGLADWNFIREVKKALHIPVFANGNILSFQDVCQCLEQTGVDGVMCAEAILHNPALFTGENPLIWDIAEELIEAVNKYPIHLKNIRTYLFRIWQYSLDIHKDLRQLLAESSKIAEFKQISNELKQRISCQIDKDNSKLEHGQTNLDNNEYTLPLQFAHSRPRTQRSQSTADKVLCDEDKFPTVVDKNALSKKALRKLNRYERVITARQEKRKEKKLKRKLRRIAVKNLEGDKNRVEDFKVVKSEKVTKKEMKANTTQKMLNARGNAPVICIDLTYIYSMSQKEQTKLVTQLGRFYGSNKKASLPFHIYLTSLDKSSSFYQLCCQKNDGFEKYLIEMTNKSPLEMFNHEKIVQLSPDAELCLECVDKDGVYILGGIVDETINKNLTVSKADKLKLQSARLPIPEYLDHADKGTYSKVLSINQVFDILLTQYESRDWIKALMAGIPKRNGFIPKS